MLKSWKPYRHDETVLQVLQRNSLALNTGTCSPCYNYHAQTKRELHYFKNDRALITGTLSPCYSNNAKTETALLRHVLPKAQKRCAEQCYDQRNVRVKRCVLDKRRSPDMIILLQALVTSIRMKQSYSKHLHRAG